MLTTTGERCGIASYSAALIKELRRLPETEVEVVPLTPGRQPIEHYLQQAERLNDPEVELVHIQHEYGFWGGYLPGHSAFWEMRPLIKKPVVLTAHTPISLKELLHIADERRPHRWLVKKFLLANRAYRESVELKPYSTSFTIVHTAAARDRLLASGAHPERVFLIPTGIPAAQPAATGGRLFRDWYGLHGKRVLTLFGYVTPNKGYELTLKILSSLPKDVVFVIAGGARLPAEEQYVQTLRHHISKSGESERVIITGYLSEEQLAEVMQGSDLFLVPHTQATNSYSITIPLSHGKPILASDLYCFQETAERGDCVELFESGNESDYRRRLLALLDNAERRRELACNALKYAARFAWPNVAAATQELYKLAIQQHDSLPCGTSQQTRQTLLNPLRMGQR